MTSPGNSDDDFRLINNESSPKQNHLLLALKRWKYFIVIGICLVITISLQVDQWFSGNNSNLGRQHVTKGLENDVLNLNENVKQNHEKDPKVAELEATQSHAQVQSNALTNFGVSRMPKSWPIDPSLQREFEGKWGDWVEEMKIIDNDNFLICGASL